jgi:hypothetical protein
MNGQRAHVSLAPFLTLHPAIYRLITKPIGQRRNVIPYSAAVLSSKMIVFICEQWAQRNIVRRCCSLGWQKNHFLEFEI